jgi:hypothetical protein
MAEPDQWQRDRLAPQSVHDLLTLLTVIRGQEHMVRRWVRLHDTADGSEGVLERLALSDAMILQLAAELTARSTAGDGDPVRS